LKEKKDLKRKHDSSLDETDLKEGKGKNKKIKKTSENIEKKQKKLLNKNINVVTTNRLIGSIINLEFS
jgi:hypothetical protein